MTHKKQAVELYVHCMLKYVTVLVKRCYQTVGMVQKIHAGFSQTSIRGLQGVDKTDRGPLPRSQVLGESTE